MSARLRVGVVAGQGSLGAATGHGRAWEHLLARVRAHVDIVEVAGPARGRPRGVDVWWFDGHVAFPAVAAPSVVLVHDVRWTDPAIAATLPVSFLAVIVPETEVAVRSATRVAVPSRFARDGVLEAYGADPARVDVVPYGVDPTVFRPGLAGGPELVAAALARRAGAAGPGVGPAVGLRPYVLFVGTVEPRKHLPVLRDAMAAIAHTHGHVLAVRAGPAPGADSRSLLAAAGAELPGMPGRVAVLPPLAEQELAAVMAGADVLCLPSAAEGFGFPVLEAMALGTPVVVAARGSLPELVGDAGILVEPSAGAVADGLRSVLDDPARAAALARLGPERARRFGWDASARALVESLTRAADERGRAAPPAPRGYLPVAAVFEVTACPACGAPRRGSAMVGSARVPLRRCSACRVVFASRGFEPGVIAPDDDARALDPEWFGFSVPDDVMEDQRERSARGRLGVLAAPPGRPKLRVAPGASGRRLLDVQRGVGTGARVAAEDGWDVTTTTTLRAATALAGEFDVLAVVHALAREADVLGALRDLRTRVRPGGWLLVETPNWDSATRRRGVDGWHGARPLEHLVHFTRSTLSATLARAGWEPEWVGTRTWLGGDVVRDTHALVPFRRVLRAAEGRGARAHLALPQGAAAAMIDGITRAYDAVGTGDVVVALARRPFTDAVADSRAPAVPRRAPGAVGS